MSSKSLLKMDCNEAREFFLENESYCNFNLPKYFTFNKLLKKISKKLNSEIIYKKLKDISDLNHIIYTNKDSDLSWRALQLINPVLYVNLVHIITDEDNWRKIKEIFTEFQKDKRIKCASMPVKNLENNKYNKEKQIQQWWNKVEQESLVLSLDYDYLFETDIADCYPSIYTHSIDWAIEGKENAKSNKNNRKRLGAKIDQCIQDMQYGQTNGIPQGSVLMDFIAEIVLGYVDKLVLEKINNDDKLRYIDFKVIRYRDDYKIFVKKPSDGKNILKLLSNELREMGLRMNSNKTKDGVSVISGAFKKDKLSYLKINYSSYDLRKQAILIREFSLEYPNSGSVVKMITQFDEKIRKKKGDVENINQIISIITDIACKNTKYIANCCSVLSYLLSKLDEKDKDNFCEKIFEKFTNINNCNFAMIWLQRVIKDELKKDGWDLTNDNLYCLASDVNFKLSRIWNIGWLDNEEIKLEMLRENIFDQCLFDERSEYMDINETKLFLDNGYG